MLNKVFCVFFPYDMCILPMTSKHRIVLVEDHTILREGLRSLLREHDNLQVVGEAADGRSGIRLTLSQKPDLVLMDLSMPKMNGFEAIREIKKTEPDIKIIALTVHNTEEYILMTLQAGADGYVLKDATHDELIMAIRQVLSGKRFLSPSVSGKVIEGYLEGKKNTHFTSPMDSLTHREREVLKLIAEGHKNKDVAEFLCISLKTVEKHRANLMRKLDLHNTSALTLYAVKKGLVER
jgi:DNA-binding NarL/FixJ family response regulator